MQSECQRLLEEVCRKVHIQCGCDGKVLWPLMYFIHNCALSWLIQLFLSQFLILPLTFWGTLSSAELVELKSDRIK